MNDRQTLTLKMIHTVLATLRNTTQTSGIAGLPARVTTLANHVEEINALGEEQTRPVPAATAERDMVLERMKDAAIDIAAAVALYATDEKLPRLLEMVRVNEQDFDYTKLPHRSWLATRIVDAAESVLPQLGDRVTAETIAAARALIREAEAAMAQSRAAVEAKVAATRELRVAFQQAQETLTQIDRLLLPLRKTDPAFHAKYRSARRVIGGRSRSAEGEPEVEAPAATLANASAGAAVHPSATSESAKLAA